MMKGGVWTVCAFAVTVSVVLQVVSCDDGVPALKHSYVDSDYTPQQIHLAVGAKATDMTVSWVTKANGTEPNVWYGTNPSSLDQQSVGESLVYTAKTVPKTWPFGFVHYVSPLIHHVQLTGLKPGVVYYYKVGDTSFSAGTSPVLNFTRANVGPSEFPTSFTIVGDMGQTSNSASTLAHMMQDVDAAAVLHAGDMSYSDCDNPRWDSWANLVQPLASNKAWMVSAGNHEIEPDGSGKIMAGYKARFRMPEAQPTEDDTKYFQNPSDDGYDCTPSAFTGDYNYGNSFYSAEIGPAHIIFLNSYTRTDESSKQYAWLESDLASVDRSVTPWVLAVWHSPWYNSNDAHYDEFNTVAMRASMESLLHKWGVAVAFNGHVHAYERSFPVYQNQTNPAGTVYIGIGDGGNREGLADSWHASPSYSAFHSGGYYGHGTLKIVSNKSAMWQWHRNVDDEWVVADSTTINNPAM